jgi:hypothetical protein
MALTGETSQHLVGAWAKLEGPTRLHSHVIADTPGRPASAGPFVYVALASLHVLSPDNGVFM